MTQPTWIGKTLSDRYRIDELLGQGGMSAVYKATDPNLKRVVAIKLIHAHLAGDAQFIQRFEEEATAVASLRHPNIVQVYDFNTDDGTYYMVLEFIAGETLQDHLRRLTAQDRKIPLSQALKIMINMSDALAYAHQRGMVHRDIKPANIMLDVYGQAILMDFGIVKIMGGSNHTATGAVVGTARYMSPEIIRAEAPDPRSDIYSLGVTLFEMLSGQAPYNADSAMTLMMMHLNDPIPDPRNLRSDIPLELVEILNKALAKDRNNRYSDINSFGNDLRQVLVSLEDKTASAKSVPVNNQPATIVPAAVQGTPSVNRTGSQPVMDAATQYEQRQPMMDSATQYEQRQPNRSSVNNVPPPPPPSGIYQMSSPPEKKRLPLWVFLGGGGVLLFVIALVIGGVYLLNRQFGGSVKAAIEPPDATVGMAQVVNTTAPPATATIDTGLSATETARAAVTATNTLEPTATFTPLPTNTPTATLPPLYVRINDITITNSNYYQVTYETFGYTEQLPGMHIHFFFNTVPSQQAGVPGSGPWYLYGGPRPFSGYAVSQRPSNATKMCALVANSNHSVILESGNCFDLP
jgi:serine/threonine protein kinase